MTSQSVLKSVQIFSLRNFLWQIMPLTDYAHKKRIFKTDANLSLKRWLALEGRKSCANVKNAVASSPLSLFIVLQHSVSDENNLLCWSVGHLRTCLAQYGMLYVVLSPRCLSLLLFLFKISFSTKWSSFDYWTCMHWWWSTQARRDRWGTTVVGNERQCSQIQLFPLLSVCVRFQKIS